MRKRLRWAIALGAVGAIVFAAAAYAKSKTEITVIVGNLVLKVDAGVTPKALPKSEFAPIKFKLSAKISTKDGKHPPAADKFNGAIDKNGSVNAKGLAVCKQGQLEARTTAAAVGACKGALVGEGFATAEVEFAEQAPFDAKGPLRVFNGGVQGSKTKLLIHVYANVPAPTAFITPVTLTKTNKGPYGLTIDSKIPEVAGGAGSLIDFEITNYKIFNYKGKKQSYFQAKCATGKFLGLSDVTFKDGSRLKGTVTLPCTQKG